MAKKRQPIDGTLIAFCVSDHELLKSERPLDSTIFEACRAASHGQLRQ
jgi:hypothetical protein